MGVDVGEEGGDGLRGGWRGAGGEGAGLRGAHAGEIDFVFVGGAACVTGVFIEVGGIGGGAGGGGSRVEDLTQVELGG